MYQGLDVLQLSIEPAMPQLAIVVPTFNECENITPLLGRLRAALAGIPWEAVFVDDDSTDGTVEELERACRSDPRIRCIRRIGRRGLSSAVVEGMQSTTTPFIAVMDADLQHDEALLAPMLSLLRAGEADLVVGSRYIAEGGVGAWGKRRQSVSVLATRLSRLVLKERVLGDPMSGFFMLTRAAYDQAVRKLSIQGYKILLDIVASSPVNLRVRELPYVFGVRQHGASKLDSVVVLDYLTLLLDKLVGRWVPARFLLFTTVGAFGLAVHFAILALALLLAFPFIVSQSLAAVIAMTGNFFINNVLTYRDKRIRGFAPLLLGLLGFCAVCSVGAVANVGIANFMFARNYSWWLSGLCGVMVGAVWNYAASSVVTWRR